MKNVFKFSLVLGLVLLTRNVIASDVDFLLDVKIGRERMVTYPLNDFKSEDFTSFDAEKVMVYTEGVSYLAADAELKKAKNKKSNRGKNDEYSETPIFEEFIPVFVKYNSLVKFNLLNLNELPTVIKIYDRYDVLVYDSGVINDQIISMVFDIYNIEYDEYTIAVSCKGMTFSKTFSKT